MDGWRQSFTRCPLAAVIALGRRFLATKSPHQIFAQPRWVGGPTAHDTRLFLPPREAPRRAPASEETVDGVTRGRREQPGYRPRTAIPAVLVYHTHL